MVYHTKKHRKKNRKYNKKGTKRFKGGATLVIESPGPKSNGNLGNLGKTKIYINPHNITVEEPYLRATSYNKVQQDRLMELFYESMNKYMHKLIKDVKQVQSLFDLKEKVKKGISYVYPLSNPYIAEKKEWVSCNDKCFTILKNLIQIETESTAYMLRTLYSSIINVGDNKQFIRFILPDDLRQLNGTWEHDMEFIYVETSTSTGQNRFIYALGPSASGKTHSAKNMITLMSKADLAFPKIFLSIDGGIYRETSIVYQYIVKEAHARSFAGLKNLVLAGVSLGTSLFKSGDIKKSIETYLETKIKGNISLYVPDTLAGCGVANGITKPCEDSYKKYINITGDNQWIVIFIWQHLLASDCPLKDNYKCESTTKSGTKRQTTEGKEFDGFAWIEAYRKGMKHGFGIDTHTRRVGNIFRSTSHTLLENVKGAPGEQIRIHNCGRKGCTSILEYFTPPRQRNVNIYNTLSNSDNQQTYHYEFRDVYDNKDGTIGNYIDKV